MLADSALFLRSTGPYSVVSECTMCAACWSDQHISSDQCVWNIATGTVPVKAGQYIGVSVVAGGTVLDHKMLEALLSGWNITVVHHI